MSKTLRTVAMIAGAVALVATGIGAAAGAGMLGAAAAGSAGVVAGISVGTIATVATVASVVAGVASMGSVLLMKKPPARGASTDIVVMVDPPQPYMIGRTYNAGVLRHEAGYGANMDGVENPFLSRVMVYSGAGPIQEIESFNFDFKPVFPGSGYFAGFLALTSQIGLCPQPAAMAAPYSGLPNWGSEYKLSGQAAAIWGFKFDKDAKRYSSGIPPYGIIARGVKVYDPRKDSTYPGGSGPQRIDNESTWEFSENPALHAIAYSYGRFQNGKRVFGIGLPASGIDLARFVQWATVCDLNAWKVGGVIFEPGSKWDNLKDIMAAGGAEPLFAGGVLSVYYNAPAPVLETVTENDLGPDDQHLTAMQSYRDRKNGIIPKFRSESNHWQYISLETVKVDSYIDADGEERFDELQYNLVQDGYQARQLAAYELLNSREMGPIVVTLKPQWRRYKPGDRLRLNIPALDLDHVVTIKQRHIDPSSLTVRFTCVTETAGKDSFALGQTATVPPPPALSTPEQRDAAASNNDNYTKIDDIRDADGNPYAPGDLVTSEGTAARVAMIGDFTEEDFAAKVEQAEQNILNLALEFGDTANAAASAAAADAAKVAAELARDNAETFATDSETNATAAAGSAATANTKAGEAGVSATAAAASATTASTRAGEASASATNSAASAETAEGFSNSAQSSATLAATTKGQIDGGAASLFPKPLNPSLFFAGVGAAAEPTYSSPSLESEGRAAWIDASRAFFTVEGSIFAIYHRGLVPWVTGRTYRIHADVEIIEAPSTVRIAAGGRLLSETFGNIGDYGWWSRPNAAKILDQGQRGTFTDVLTVPAVAAGVAWLRPMLLLARQSGNVGAAVHGVKSRVHAFWIEDITEATNAGNSATVATNQAATATNQAAAATNQATLAAAYAGAAAATGGLTLNAHFKEGLTGWKSGLSAPALTAGWQASFQGAQGVFVQSPPGSKWIYSAFSPVNTARKYKIRGRVWSSGHAGRVYIGVSCINADGAPIGTNSGLVYSAAWAGILKEVGWHDVNTEVFTGTSDSGFNAFRPGTAQVSVTAIFNHNGNESQSFAVDYLYIEDVTESEAALTSAIVAGNQAATATSQAATATSQAVLAAEANRIANIALAPTFPPAMNPALFSNSVTIVSPPGGVANLELAGFGSWIAPARNFITPPAGHTGLSAVGTAPAEAGRTYRFYADIEILSTGTAAAPLIATRFSVRYLSGAWGSVSNVNLPVINRAAGRHLIQSDLTIPDPAPVNAVNLRPMIHLNRATANAINAEPGAQTRVHAFWIEDITESVKSGTSATVAESQAAIATAQAAAAEASAIVAASAAPAAVFKNATFAQYPSAALGALPTSWEAYLSAAQAQRATGFYGGYSVVLPAAAGVSAGFKQVNAARVVSPGEYFVIEAELTLNSGSLVGAGVHLAARNSSNAVVDGFSLILATDKSATGAVTNGTAGVTYRFQKIGRITNANANNLEIRAASHAPEFGAIANANSITWHKVTARPATAAEIDLGAALPSLEAAVQNQAAAIATATSRTASYLTRVAAGAGSAELSLVALDSNGNAASQISLKADSIKLGSLTDPVLFISGGQAYFAGKLNAGTVDAAAISVSSLSAISSNLGTIEVGTANIANLAISTLKIQNQAVTVPVAAYTAAITQGTNNWVTIQTVSIAASGAPIRIDCNFLIRHDTEDNQKLDVEFYRGSTLIYSATGIMIRESNGASDNWLPVHLAMSDTPTVGTHNYSFRVKSSQGASVKNKGLYLLETKK